ncbi:MAG: hypothetical protein JXA30_22905 [Deltaproteobacteria bacterium]|nr:hypothetical protein [Deltaproteobacteria bacterium]
MKENRIFAGWLCCLLLLWQCVAGCMSAEDIFTSGRIENLCSNAVPICGDVAGCVLSDEHYIRGEFPGDQVVIVRSEVDRVRIVARFLLSQEMYPGMFMSVRACSIGCAQCEEEISKDKNLFELANDDGILEYHLDVEGRGDHKVEYFSDMAAKYLFTIELEE